MSEIETEPLTILLRLSKLSGMRTPANVVIEVCGGPRAVAEMCGIDVTWVYRWTYSVERGGTGGTIPSKHQARLLKEAQARGIALKPAHFFPADAA